MDDADMTADRQEAELAMKRMELAKLPKRELLPLGACYNCDEKLEDDKKLFCDSDCRADWEKLDARRN